MSPDGALNRQESRTIINQRTGKKALGYVILLIVSFVGPPLVQAQVFPAKPATLVIDFGREEFEVYKELGKIYRK